MTGGRGDRRHVPHPSRLAPDAPRRDEILRRHDEALDDGRPSYVDPATGYHVFTADHLAERGSCCESGCRHCPYL